MGYLQAIPAQVHTLCHTNRHRATSLSSQTITRKNHLTSIENTHLTTQPRNIKHRC